MVVSMLNNSIFKYSSYYFIKFVGFIPIYYTIKFECLIFLGFKINLQSFFFLKEKREILKLLSKNKIFIKKPIFGVHPALVASKIVKNPTVSKFNEIRLGN